MRKTIALTTLIIVLSIFGISAQTKPKKQAKPDENTHNILVPEIQVPVEENHPSKDTFKGGNEVREMISIEQAPEFPGGEEGIMNYIANHIHYPDSAKKYNVKGKVFVRFIVEKDGSISDVHLAKSKIPGNDMGCIAEAIRVVKTMPKFIEPAKQNGMPVRISYSVPVNFNSIK